MRRDIDALSQPFDLLVIGAGIHGACLARLAALSGLRTALIEKGDFGAATSRNSAKLLHGGLRYIQHFDVPRIRESMVAQRAWFRFAPHLVRPLRFVIPTYGYGTRGPAALAGGVVAFHMIAAGRNDGIADEVRLPRSGITSRRRLLAAHPALQRRDVTGGAFWYDGQMLDAIRVTLECIWDAVEAGAVALNHVECVALRHGARGVEGVVARDRLTGREVEVTARMTVNATGPWVDRVLAGGPKAVHGERTTVWTRNVNLVTRRLYGGGTALGVQSKRKSDAAIGESKRLFFTSPWHGCTVVGTTHDHYDDDPDAVEATDDLVAGFVQEVNDAAPGLGLAPQDVHSVHLGLTPAEDAESERAKRSLLLDHEARHGIHGLLSVAGIKYTTAPVVAAQTLELVCRKLGHGRAMPPFETPARGAPSRVMPPPAEGSNGTPDCVDELGWAQHIYGRRASDCLQEAAASPLDADAVFRDRVRYGVQHEMIVRLGDALLRATDWAERGRLTAPLMNWCAEYMAAELHWSGERRRREYGDAVAALRRLHIDVMDVGSAPAS